MKKLLQWTIISNLFIMFAMPVDAGPLGKAFGGALGGATLGALVGDEDSAKTGAIIGGSLGLIGGAAQASKQKQAQEAAKRQEVERQQLLQQQQQQTDTTLVLEIQKSLVRMGFDPGDVNGQLQPMTVSAIKQYETKRGLLETGRPSPELHKHMLRNGG